jgi:hypothetical protein
LGEVISRSDIEAAPGSSNGLDYVVVSRVEGYANDHDGVRRDQGVLPEFAGPSHLHRRRIVDSLSLPLTAREERMLKHDVPSNARAYESYLRANALE